MDYCKIALFKKIIFGRLLQRLLLWEDEKIPRFTLISLINQCLLETLLRMM